MEKDANTNTLIFKPSKLEQRVKTLENTLKAILDNNPGLLAGTPHANI